MCGIAGTIDPLAERASAKGALMNGAQAHRGPDHRVVTAMSGIAVGNTRLAIQDPTPAGNQPFASADGRYVSVFNGEIYNYQRLAERFALPVLTGCDSATALGHGGAKARRLISKTGPRSALGLTRLQRELFPAPVVNGLTGESSGRQDRGADDSPWPAANAPDSFAAMVATEVAVYLQATLLPDADAFSMASSVELRVPFVDSHVFSALLDTAARSNRAPGKAALGAALGDPYLKALAAQPKRGFGVPMERWLAESLAPLLAAASNPDAPVWTVLDRQVAGRAGLLPLRSRSRLSETWALAALNEWLETRPASDLIPQL